MSWEATHQASRTSVFTHAHRLADAGYAVLPTAKSKAPLTPHGVHDASHDHNQINLWSRDLPDANLAVACGEASGYLLVADIDTIEAARVRGRLRLPSAPTVRTGGGGYHLWCSSNTRPFRTVVTPWGELRGGGSYVLAPPSRHLSGSRYEWAVPLDFEEPLPVEALSSFLPGIEQALERGYSQESSSTWTKAQCLGSPGPLRELVEAARWAAVARSPEVAEGFCRIFNLPPPGRHFRCLLPGCEGASTEHGVLWNSPEGIKYRCFHRGALGTGKHGVAMSIPAVYAAVVAGRRSISNVELVTWTKRLLLDAGLVERLDVQLPHLPEGLPESRYALKEVVQSHFEARAVGVGLEPTPLANDFLAGLSGLSKTTVLRAKGDLIKHKIIVKAGTYETAYGKPGSLYLPGGRA